MAVEQDELIDKINSTNFGSQNVAPGIFATVLSVMHLYIYVSFSEKNESKYKKKNNS